MKKALIIFVSLCISLTVFAQTKPQAKTQPKGKSKAAPVQAKKTPKPYREKERMVEITTDFGTMVAVLYNETPKHRDNFVKLVQQGFYDSLLFHRIIKNFMIQGGDPLSKTADSTAMLGNGDVGYRIPAEFDNRIFHKKGALAAARDNNPERASSGCQFYIVQGRTYTVEELEKIINTRNLTRKQMMMYNLFQSDTVQNKLQVYQAKGDKEGQQKYMLSLQEGIEKEYNKQNPNTIDYGIIDYYMKVGGTPHLDGDYTVFGELVSGLEVLDKLASVQTGNADRPLKDIRMKIKLLN
ncbi:MAG: peptidylprolyl isomerase [Bacteroidetes bacterium]|nr:peptidylprolyl isomerase [Bacteroidota bacterium]